MEYQSNTIYVGGLPAQAEAETLFNYFSQYEPVLHCKICPPRGLKSNPHGIVSFQSSSSADRLLSVQHFILGQAVRLDRAIKCSPKDSLMRFCQGDTKSLYLFIQDIPKCINKQSLVEYFSQFGELTAARLSVVPYKFKDRIYLQFADIETMASVKRMKHFIPELSSEKITLVCKIGMFKTPKQVQILLDSEDLLSIPPQASSTKKALSSNNISYTLSKASEYLLTRPCSPINISGKGYSFTACATGLNESPSNYRFNLQQPRRINSQQMPVPQF